MAIKRGHSGMNLKVIIAVAVLCAAAYACMHFVTEKQGEPDGVIAPADMLCEEGTTATLAAELEGARGETLEFMLDGKVVGSAKTDADGIARADYRPPEAGDYVFTVRLANGSKHVADKAELTLCVRKKEQEFLVTDIDQTISDAGNIAAWLKSAKDIRPMAGSAEALTALSKKYTIVYVTARAKNLRAKTKEWLGNNGFPAGPVFFSEDVEDSMKAEAYKTELLGRLKAQWPNMSAGAGDQASDARAYLANGMKACIYRKPGESAEDEKEERAKYPAGTMFFASWQELQKMLIPEGN
jgi:hypothetical protein